jgi:hypothetical protein
MRGVFIMAKKEIAPELLAEARRLYEQTLAPVDDIASVLGMTRTPFYKIVNREGWRGRRARSGTFHFASALTAEGVGALMPAPADQPRAEMEVNREPVAPWQRNALAQRIMIAAERDIDAVERILAKVGPNDAIEIEYSARVVASVARTLREIAALNEPNEVTPADDTDDDPVPLDIDEFRLELARRIHVLVDARRNRESGGGGGAVARLEPPAV